MSLINAMLAFDPTQRLSIAEIMQHPWYKGDVPSDDEIKTELEQRKQYVDHQKEVERQQQIEVMKMRKAAKEAGVHSNIFQHVPTFRSISKDG